MKYEVKLTETATQQLGDALFYISKVLLEPKIARDFSERIKKEIISLENMPFRHPLVHEEPWKTEGIRKMVVGNFLVYYWVDGADSVVWVTAVVYGRRDQLSVLRKMPKE